MSTGRGKLRGAAVPAVVSVAAGVVLWIVGPGPTFPAEAAVAGPQASLQNGAFSAVGGGEYTVGEAPGQLFPGLYTATVPDDSLGCVWEQRTMSGAVRSGYANAHAVLEVDVDDTAMTFRTHECGVWVLRR